LSRVHWLLKTPMKQPGGTIPVDAAAGDAKLSMMAGAVHVSTPARPPA
jgi:hypothetical protein